MSRRNLACALANWQGDAIAPVLSTDMDVDTIVPTFIARMTLPTEVVACNPDSLAAF